jgi:hypothetical protein
MFTWYHQLGSTCHYIHPYTLQIAPIYSQNAHAISPTITPLIRISPLSSPYITQFFIFHNTPLAAHFLQMPLFTLQHLHSPHYTTFKYHVSLHCTTQVHVHSISLCTFLHYCAFPTASPATYFQPFIPQPITPLLILQPPAPPSRDITAYPLPQ